MLETNKPFIFGSSSTTSSNSDNNNNSTSPPPTNTTSELPRPMNSFYYKEEKESYLSSYQGQPAKLNSAFSHPLPHALPPPEEYTYKTNSSSSSSYTQLLPMSHHYSSPSSNLMKHIKEESPIYSLKHNYNTFDESDNWFDTQYEGDLGDNNRKAKKRKEMTLKMEKLNAEFLEKKERY